MTKKKDFNQNEYYKDKEEKRKFWVEYANKILAKPKANYSECKTAAIGVSQFDPVLEQKLLVKKGKPTRY